MRPREGLMANSDVGELFSYSGLIMIGEVLA
jgi:hypothetical protein